MATPKLGKAGEDYAALFLQQAGLCIVARNYHSRYGEVDIIATDASCIIFAEVKTRTVGSLGTPAEAVTARKQGRIIKTAERYLLLYPSNLQPRFDVLEVIAAKDATLLSCNHLQNAFGLF